MKLTLPTMTIILLLTHASLSRAEIVITETNKDVVCPIAEQLMYKAYDRAYAFSTEGKISDPNKLKLAILSSQSFWDLYPTILNCPNAKMYEEQFSRLGLNNVNAKLENNTLQSFANIYTQDQRGMFKQGSTLTTPTGSVILSGSQAPDKDKLTITVPADIYKQQLQQPPSP